MKIYLASSWKMRACVLRIAKELRAAGHEVDAFCDEETRLCFNWDELAEIMENEGLDRSKLNACDMMQHWRVRGAFYEDKKMLDWADAVVMIMPCGRSAHMEAGYAAGAGKKTVYCRRVRTGRI